MRAQRRHPMGRLGLRAERGERQIADVMIAIELSPGKTLALVVDRDGFAEERLGLQRRVRRGRTPQRRVRFDDLHRPPVRVARRVDDAPHMRGGEVGTDGGEPAVVCAGHVRAPGFEVGEGSSLTDFSGRTQGGMDR